VGLAFISLPLVKDLLNISINMHQHVFFSPSVDIGIGWILLDFVGFCSCFTDYKYRWQVVPD
jgi:hypothetical protein